MIPPKNDSARLAALRRYAILDTPAEAEFDDFTALAAQICGTPIALVSLVDAHRQWFKSKVGIEAAETPRDIAFCNHAIADTELFEVPDAMLDERFKVSPLVTADPNIRFYAGAPLTTSEGYNLGTLCVIDRKPRQLSPEQREALARLGRQVVARMELRLTNRRLAEQTNFQQTILNSAASAIIATTTDGIITHFSPAAERMLGYRAAEMIGQLTPGVFHDPAEVVARAPELSRELGQEIAPGFEVFVAKARAGESETREWTYVRKNGSRFPVLLSISALRDAAGGISGFLGIARDLTERNQLEQELRDSHARLQDLFDNCGDLIHGGAPDGRLLFTNRAWRTTLGYTEAETEQLNVFTIIHPDYREQCRTILRRLMGGEDVGVVDVVFVAKDGRRVEVEGRVSVRHEHGQPVSTRGIFRNVTARRAAQRERNRFFNLSLDLLCIASTDGWFKRVNPAFTATLGWSEAELLGRPFFDFVHPDDHAATVREVEQLAAGQPTMDFENRYLCKNGMWKTIGWRCQPQPDGTLFATGRDVSELKQAEDALRRSEESLSITLSSIADAVLTTDARGRVTRMNPVAEKLTGWPEAEALGRPVDEVFRIIHEETRQPAVIPVDAVLIAGELHGLANHTALLTRDGREISIAESTAPRRDAGGNITGVVLVFRDVTEERRAERRERAQAAQSLTFQTALLALRDYEGEELTAFYHVATAGIAHALNVERVSLWFFTEGLAAIECHDLFQRSTQNHERGLRLAAADYPAYFQAVSHHGSVVADDARTHPATREFTAGYLEPLGITSMLDVPIRLGGRLVGVVCCEHVGPARRWTPAEGKFTTSAASYVMLALEQAERRKAEDALRTLNATLEQQVAERTTALRESLTAIIQAQQQGERLQQQFHALFEFAPDAMLMTDASGLITLANQQAERIFGYARGELPGQPVEMLMPENTRRGHVVSREGYLATTLPRTMGVGRSSLKARKKDGTSFPVEISLAPMSTAAGKVVVAAVRDITERVQAEERMRSALATLDATEDGALIFDPETLRFSYANEGAVRQLGYTREELLALTPVDIQPEFTEAQFRVLIEPLTRGEKGNHQFITAHRRKDGQELPVEISLKYVTPSGERPRFIAIVRDITQRLAAEKKDRRSQRLESIGTLAGGVAHDLNNTLAPILMVVELLRMEYPEKAGEYITIVEQGAKRGADMVRQLLTFAKGTEGDRVLIQLRHQLKDIEKIIRSTFDKSIRLEIRQDKELAPIVGDATQIHQILLNLCVNARDAMPSGGTLTIEADNFTADEAFTGFVAEAHAGPYVRVAVRDTGTGIPPEILDRIFDPFFSTKGPEKGTGLGLSTVVGIVKGHGGFLRVYSEVGRGSAFEIYLPVTEKAPGLLEPGTAEAAPLSHGELVLVVDDEAPIREMLGRLLKALGFTVISADDGSEALIHFGQHRAALKLIITDINMPAMDGLTLARTVKRLSPTTPIIAMTGLQDENRLSTLRELGVIQQLAKPFSLDTLNDALKKVFSGGQVDKR